MFDPSARTAVIQQTLQLFDSESPWLRARIEAVVDGLPHIFQYDSERRPRMVRFHVLQVLGMSDGPLR
ncbi:MAG: hypothetical protein ACI8RZ_001663 [Myxococcota bacterium]|jgi:hypothetical protein